MTADFSGWATKYNLRCSDGRTILADAFKHMDGQQVPLVYQHGHTDPEEVLGYVTLKHTNEGVLAEGYFNENPKSKAAKELVRHGDLKWLSIFANGLVEHMMNGVKAVKHGMIREVSLVLAGANPGAVIEHVNIVHADGMVSISDEDATITTGIDIEPMMAHSVTAATEDATTDAGAVEQERTLQEILDTLNEEQADAVNYLLSQALTVESDAAAQHSDTDASESVDSAESDKEADGDESSDAENAPDEAAADSEASSEDEGETAAGAEAESESAEGESGDESNDESSSAEGNTDEAGDAVQHDNTSQEDESMSITHNVFDQARASATGSATEHKQQVLAHDAVKEIMHNVVDSSHGSLKKSLKEYAIQHGIENIDYLFPDPKLLDSSPSLISRRMEWVQKVLDGVKKTPFSRIRTLHADITAEEARARGYIKGNFKEEEFFTLLRRDTTPQTIYKKQRLDRDDVLDITDLDVVAWMKAEMRLMLDEEIARAILFGDGRSNGDADKIREDKIRPIAKDAELYVTTVRVNLADANSSHEEVVDRAIANRRYLKGSGMPTFFTNEGVVSSFLQVKDGFGHRMYKTLDDIATVLRVKEVVPCEVLDDADNVIGVMVNLQDYSIGTDRGGQATMFDDFDLNYNKLLYLLETRLCGALTQPKSALVFRRTAAGDVLVVPTDPAFDGTTVTVPTVSGVTYKNSDTNATLTTGSPVTVADGTTLNVVAVPNSGYYFENDAEDQWSFTNPA